MATKKVYTYNVEYKETIVVIAIGHMKILWQSSDFGIGDGVSVKDVQPEPSYC